MALPMSRLPQSRTRSVTVRGMELAVKVAIYMVNRSVWFAIEPLPDDNWELTVKEEVSKSVIAEGLAGSFGITFDD